MNKCADKFCPDCGHHIYAIAKRNHTAYYCADCNVGVDEPATLEQVQTLRAGYDAEARKLVIDNGG